MGMGRALHQWAVLSCLWVPECVDAFSATFSTTRWHTALSRRRVSYVSLRVETDKWNVQVDSKQEGDANQTQTAKEAEQLRKRAKELMAEANAMEADLIETRTDNTKRKNEERDALINQLFPWNSTAWDVAERLARERWSPEQLTLVMERLHERQVQALGRSSVSLTPGEFQLGDTRNSAEFNEAEWYRLEGYVQSLLEAAAILDDQTKDRSNENHRWTGRVAISLGSRLKELRRTNEQDYQRRLAANVNAVVNSNSSASVQEYMRKSLGLPVEGQSDQDSRSFNISRALEQVAMIPMWIPSSLLPFLLATRSKLDSDDLKIIRTELLTKTSFYCTSSDSIPGAAIFRGNVRTPFGVVNTTMEHNQTAVVFEDIQERLTNAGLSDRIQLFFLDDPDWRPGRDEREKKPGPIILALPKEAAPEQSVDRGLAAKLLTGISITLTLLTTAAYSISCFALNPSFFGSVVDKQDITVLTRCIPLFIGVIAIQIIHEAAQYFMARRTKIKIGLPVPLPSFQLGSFGSITPLRSFPASRAALFDFALSGPVAGLLTSTGLMVGGIFATVTASSGALSNFPVVPVALLKASYFVGALFSVLAPKVMLLPSSQPVPIHPLFMMGFAGLISNALNLLPLGRLDGGRAYTAVFGSRNAALASILTMSLMALLALTGMSNIAIFWGLLVTLFQRQPEIPVRNEVTEVDDTRVGVYAASLALAILALAPFPGGQGML